MNVVLFGATGMIGAGVLIECLDDARVQSVLAVGRRPCGTTHPKLRELIRPDPTDLVGAEAELAGVDACFFCLGISAAGLSEAEYRHVTLDMTLAAARTLATVNPALTFCFVSGQGSDSSERGRIMWARVKGATENRLLGMPFSTYVFRPGLIQPLKGVRSRTWWYQAGYRVMGPLLPFVRRRLPGLATSTVDIGQAMLRVVAHGADKRILETSDINEVAAEARRVERA